MWVISGLILLPFLIVYVAILSQFGKKVLVIGLLLIPVFYIGVRFIGFLNSKTTVERHDIIGQYVIDRSKYSGPQADWQYDHYRFEIFENNTIEFYEMDGEKIINTYLGAVSFSKSRHALRIMMIDKNFHVTKKNPALYRLKWSFYYVFPSEKFNNMFFKKGKWKPIK